ncbi:FRG domain-containing protein [Pedobacter hiemivivus]|uniref:FRG domain-containing protein n=1 Tax=Pedobacter hiemivivus TaxID=2530454 RepID=A0A4R0NGV6_9SPHI|nr:FRG domain-containing protein [Pedobacter hiemivivus]TCC98513.1 FRG domain-containing protein [Pedobacter hiemivivus]
MEYWKYYEPDYKWDNYDSSDFAHTLDLLLKNGISIENAWKLIKSGYICLLGSEVLIDRFYGGAINSFDLQTRFPVNYASKIFETEASSSVKVRKVKSLKELYASIEDLKGTKELVFRGQNQNHFISREINNPFLTIPGYGEVSLLPSLWRRMFEQNPQSLEGFQTLTLMEWSNIMYGAFDLAEIEARHQAQLDAGESIYTMSEMAESSDELLREFGKFRMDLAMGLNYNLATTMTTLLQHYGLLSPVLDLTESLDVALFFATHKFQQLDGLSSYQFIGSNGGKSVIYVLSYIKYEMERHEERQDILKYLKPQRPVQQKCVVCSTNQYAINLPGLYLREVILLDFEIPNNLGVIPEQILPGRAMDKFLDTLSNKLSKKQHITQFDKNDIGISA